VLPRPLLYESWLRLKRPSVEALVEGPIDVVWAAGLVPPPSSSPVVASVHDVGFLENTERLSRRGRGFFPRVWKVIQDDVAIMVCPSQVVAADLRRHGIDDDRLRVVPLGVGAPLTKPGEEHELIRPFNLPPTFALWVGTVEPRKNLGRLVEAMTTIDDLPLVVVGPVGWNESEDDLLAPLKGRVHRLGTVEDRTLSALYRAATVFVFPSLLEGFGLPVIEAMAHGTPVVTGADTACAEVADGAAILVDVYDPAAIATGIESVVNSQAQLETMRVQGLQRAKQLTWEKAAEGYLGVFAEAAGFANGQPSGGGEG